MIFNFFKKNTNSTLSWENEFRIALGAHWGLSAKESKNLSEFNGKKIAVLADMKELGPDSPSIHANLEESVINSDLSFIYCFGTMMRYLHRQLIGKTNSAYFNDVSQSAFEIITSHLKEEDCTILIKGSKSTNISQLVGYIKAITS